MNGADVDDLVDSALIAAAEAALAGAERRLAAAKRNAEDADAQTDELRLHLPHLVEMAAGGDSVTPQAVAAVHARARDAADYATFTGALARRLEVSVADARAFAWWPVLNHGIERRIAAGAAADRVRLRYGQMGSEFPIETAARHTRREAALADVRQSFDDATRTIDLALRNGARLPPGVPLWLPEWPAKEGTERRHFNRPAEMEDGDDAL